MTHLSPRPAREWLELIPYENLKGMVLCRMINNDIYLSCSEAILWATTWYKDLSGKKTKTEDDTIANAYDCIYRMERSAQRNLKSK